VRRLGSRPHLVGRIGSGVRVSVSFRQKYPPGSVLRCPTAAENVVMTKGVLSGGGFDLRLRRITSSLSQTIRPRLVRRTATDAAVSARLDACRRSRLYISHFATYGLQYCRPICSVCSNIRSEWRFFATPTAFDATITGVPVGISPSCLARKN